jgi:RNA polymerase sigma factor (sigma-70 family)
VSKPDALFQAVFRNEFPKLVARLSRLTSDVGLAEEIAQETLLTALERWTADGLPDNPGAWLMATARNRGIDEIRKRKRVEQKHQGLAHGLEYAQALGAIAIERAADDEIGDDLLRLVFTACHPALSTESRVALTLRLLGGLTTDEIARAFLVPEPTIAQRIVRAKRTLGEKQVPFEIPANELRERVDSVLAVIYLIFNEGYSATSGANWMRPDLCEDALRLARLLTELLPEEAEAQGLLALLALQFSRFAARVDSVGEPILLLEQDRTRWDRAAIDTGLAALQRAEQLAGMAGSYTLQAAIAACHAQASTADQTDWRRIAVLYYALLERTGSPVVELNRAVAVGMAFGPAAALEIVRPLLNQDSLRDYHLLYAVHGDLLDKLGRFADAQQEFERAATLTHNAREQQVLRERAEKCARAVAARPAI